MIPELLIEGQIRAGIVVFRWIDERVEVSFCATEINGNIKIAPLILITFIENAFKYVGFNEGKENRIAIELNYDSDIDTLKFTIFNTKDIFVNTAEKSSGLGIANTKRRLELLYPERHLLEIDDQETGFTATLTLFKL